MLARRCLCFLSGGQGNKSLPTSPLSRHFLNAGFGARDEWKFRGCGNPVANSIWKTTARATVLCEILCHIHGGKASCYRVPGWAVPQCPQNYSALEGTLVTVGLMALVPCQAHTGHQGHPAGPGQPGFRSWSSLQPPDKEPSARISEHR